MIRVIYGFRSSYSCIGTVCLKERTVNSFEKLYFLPISVYCADVTRSCKISRCASIGLFIQAWMRHIRIRAKDDMAGDKIFITYQSKKYFLIKDCCRQL